MSVYPLHLSALVEEDINCNSFRTVLELGLRHFPTEFGVLFLMTNNVYEETPFTLSASLQYIQERGHVSKQV